MVKKNFNTIFAFFSLITRLFIWFFIISPNEFNSLILGAFAFVNVFYFVLFAVDYYKNKTSNRAQRSHMITRKEKEFNWTKTIESFRIGFNAFICVVDARVSSDRKSSHCIFHSLPLLSHYVPKTNIHYKWKRAKGTEIKTSKRFKIIERKARKKNAQNQIHFKQKNMIRCD